METDMQMEAQLEYVGFWSRFGAAIIDTILLLMITMPLCVAVYGWAYFESEKLMAGPADALITWGLPIALTLLFWRYRQATPGKMAIGARIVDARTGGTPSMGQWVGRYLSYFLSTLPLCLGYLWVAFDPKKQAWHDKLAGTVVVRPRNRGPVAVQFESR